MEGNCWGPFLSAQRENARQGKGLPSTKPYTVLHLQGALKEALNVLLGVPRRRAPRGPHIGGPCLSGEGKGWHMSVGLSAVSCVLCVSSVDVSVSLSPWFRDVSLF